MGTAPRVDLLVDGQWIPADIRYEGPGGRSVTISRDRGSEFDRYRPSECTFTLSNIDGRYSPRKPDSPYYGHLTRNLPVRVVRPLLAEAFGTPVTDGWGAAYTLAGGVAADYDIAGGVGTMSTGTVNTTYAASVTGMSRADACVRATITPGAVSTGALTRMGVIARYASASTYMCADVAFATTGTATLRILKRVGGAENTLVISASTLAYDASTSIVIEFIAEGEYFYARAATTADPSTVITVELTDASVTAAGSCGLRARRDTSNSNGTLVMSFDDWSVEDVRWSGEIPSFAPEMDSTGTDSWLRVSAKSVMERLTDSGRTKISAPRRWLEAQSSAPPVACWPMEDGTSADAGWPLYGRYPLYPWSGTHPSGAVVTAAQYGRGELAPWLPDAYSWSRSSGLSILSATVEMPGFSGADGWTVDVLVNVPGDSGELFIDINPSYLGGSASWPQVSLDPAGSGTVNVAMNGEPETSTTYAVLFDGSAHHVRWHAYQDGSTVSWTVAIDGTTVQTDTTAGSMTLTTVRYLGLVSAAQTGTQAAAGYVAVWDGTPPAGGTAAYAAHSGETPDERLTRVCAEEGIAYAPSATATSAAMGPQPTDIIGAIIEECEAVDLGTLHDLRGVRGLALRSRVSTLAQAAAVTLDYSAGVLSDPPVPVDGTSTTANDVTAKSPYGGQRRHTITDGPLGTAAPEDGGAGVQQRPVESNVADDGVLGDIASWVAHLGTVDAPRLPAVMVELHRPSAASVVDALLAARVGDAVAITNPPSTILPPDTLTGLIVGTAEKWDQFEHHIGLTLAPDAVQSNIGIWDDTDSRWNSQDSTLASDYVAGTDTTMSVAIAAGKYLWNTAGGYEVNVGGARVSVTSVSGATSPQTFTVTQATVNGVTKTVRAGTRVSLWRPVRWSY